MKDSNRNALFGLVSVGLLSLASSPSIAASHGWKFSEVFSNPTGTIQFIELKEAFGFASEIYMSGLPITSSSNTFVFPSILVPPTSHKHLLLATAGFAALPGVPPPDYIIPDGFFSINGDVLTYHTAFGGVYDTFTFGLGELPTDDINSLNRDVGPIPPFVVSTGVNSPTNYLGETGSVVPTGIDLGETPPLSLHQNYPNPFNPTTMIQYSIDERVRVTLRIYDVAGRLVSTLVDKVRAPGVVHSAIWDGTNESGQKMSSGMYFYRMTAGNAVLTKKLVLLKQ